MTEQEIFTALQHKVGDALEVARMARRLSQEDVLSRLRNVAPAYTCDMRRLQAIEDGILLPNWEEFQLHCLALSLSTALVLRTAWFISQDEKKSAEQLCQEGILELRSVKTINNL